ncbi:MAG: molybdenum cofactor biosynthesis protein MoaE [candidate division Zixibacteria bacterium]|nr:molybdenum cofactor biosynthesis protein MoaE [candidate division Zixibacteria bacterium]
MTAEPHIAIRTDPLTVAEIEALVADPANGAICSFSGLVRNNSHGRSVVSLEYDAYIPMAETMMHEIARDIGRDFPINRMAMVHRIGRMQVGELVVVVSAGAAHRDAAFAAARAGIDRLKKTVPIWKKEYFTDGSQWVGATPEG